MNKSIIFLIFAGMLLFNQVSGQANKQRFNYSEGVVTLKNGTVLQGQVANIKHGFRDKLLDHVRIKPWGRIFAKKYSPRKVDLFTMGDREFVSWRVRRNNSLLRETYTLHEGRQHQFFEVQLEGYLSIYLAYFIDEDAWIFAVPFFKKKDENTLVRATQGLLGLKRRMLSDYLGDCPELVELIQAKKITTPLEVANFYNNHRAKQLEPN